MSFSSIAADFQPRAGKLPSALQKWNHLEKLMADKQIILLLDYDGTLAPICTKPSLAKISITQKSQLEKLSRYYITAISSGRSLQEQINLINISNIHHIANYGYEIKSPFAPYYKLQNAENFAANIDESYFKLVAELGNIEGILIENKKYSLSVHFRLVAKELVNHIESTVDKITKDSFLLRKFYSKKVFEIRPNINWDKGDAILWLTHALNLDKNDILPIYIGDDVTDEPAFESVRDFGIGILVSKYYQTTLAKYQLEDVDEVWKFLGKLLKRCTLPLDMPIIRNIIPTQFSPALLTGS